MAADTPQTRTLTVLARDLQPGDRLNVDGTLVSSITVDSDRVCIVSSPRQYPGFDHDVSYQPDALLTISRPERAE